MSNNVLTLPVHRKPGRPRLRQLPNTKTAGILDFPSLRPTLEQKLADYHAAINLVARGLHEAVSAICELDQKYPRD